MVHTRTEDDGLRHPSVLAQPSGDAAGDHLGASLEDDVLVIVGRSVFPILDLIAVVVLLPLLRTPAHHVHIKSDADHLVRREESVLDSLFERIGIDRLPEVGDVRHLAGFLRRRRHAEMDGIGKIGEYFTPRRILPRAPTMALVNHDEVEVSLIKVFVVFLSVRPDELLVKGKVDVVCRIEFAVLDLGHHLAEWLEVLHHRLVDEDVAVGEEENLHLLAFALTRLPEPMDDLKRRVRLAGPRRHN